jgi:hypothetical protein
LARHLLTLGFTDAEKQHMHDLATRNQDGVLSPLEQETLIAYARAGTVLSILKSEARQTLRKKSHSRKS